MTNAVTNAVTNAYQNICKDSTAHLKKSRQSYCTHLSRTWAASFHMMSASVALLVHGVVPAWCKTTGSTIILHVAEEITEHSLHESTVTTHDLE